MPDDVGSLEGIESANQAASDNLNANHFQGEQAVNIAPNEAKAVNVNWHYSDEIPGVGEKPDWFLEDKYANISQQAEAYIEANKKLGQFAGAPKDGYNLEKYKDKVNIDSPFIHKLQELSKNQNMTQDGLDQHLALFMEYEKANTPDTDEFIRSLTPPETEMAKNTYNWMQNNFTEDENEVLSKFVTDKTSLNIVAKMRAMSRENRIPNTSASPTSHLPTLEDLQSLMINNRDKYNNDPAYRDRIEKQRAEIFQRGERS